MLLPVAYSLILLGLRDKVNPLKQICIISKLPMLSFLILFLGTFWEASMDIIGSSHNYEKSFWKNIANCFEKRGIKKLGNQFWDPSLAWRNKWRMHDPNNGEAFPGSASIFVTLMDGWHLVKFIWLIHLFLCIVLYTPVTDYLLLDCLLLYIVFGIGHELFFSLIQKDTSLKNIG